VLGPFGGGPGSYFDLARFTFQFPLNTSAADASLTAKQKTIVMKFITPNSLKMDIFINNLLAS
jgi:hypothetical protein